MMRAAVCHRLGTPDEITTELVPRPEPGPGEALIRVHAAAVNLPDVLIAAGRYQVPVPPPFTPGSEFAGVVVGVGSQVTGVRVGDRVAGAAMSGAFAEYVAAPATSLIPVPAGVDLATAAASWVCHLTAYHALRSIADIAPGERLVV
ncbi:alcohol dehydrogenase catalytic domain-containing protein, partial [Frankia sp. ACN1ag]